MKKILFLFFCFVLSSISIYANEWDIKIIQPNINTQNINGFDELKVHDLFSWAWVYDISMEFPKGSKNIEIDLNMLYNSYSKDAFSPYWTSWSLQWLGTIQRSIKQWTTEIYNRNDFAINGEDLILFDQGSNLYVSKYTNNLNKYYLENDIWRVLDTKGNTYIYWKQDISRLSDPENISKIFAWYLDSMTDNRGNTIDYSYFKDNNQVYLKEVSYAWGLYKITFQYKDKQKSLSSYKSHFEVKTSKILDRINFSVNDAIVKYYDFTYDNIHSVFSHLINFKEIIVWDNGNHNIIRNIDLTYGKWADIHLLKTISTNTGLDINFTYKPSVFYKDKQWNNLNPTLPFNVRTLHEINYKDIVNNITRKETYIYADGAFYFDKNDLHGREYAGFWKVTKDILNGKKEIYYFHQWANSKDTPELWEYDDHISKKGRVYRLETYNQNDILLQSEITKWITEFNSQDRWKVLKNREIISYINWVNIVSSAQEYFYDIYWNIIEEINYWEVNLVSDKWDFIDIWEDKIIEKNNYIYNQQKNLYGFIHSQEKYNFYNELFSKIEIFYDNYINDNIDFWDVTLTRNYKNPTDYIENKTEYNLLWLPIKQISPKWFITSLLYDNYGIYPVSQTNAKWFTQKFVFDYISWKPSEIIDINNNKKVFEYDNAWRLISEKIILWNNSIELKKNTYDSQNIPNSITSEVFFDENKWDSQKNYVYLDWFGNTIQTKKTYNNQYITQKFRYDGNGNMIFSWYPKNESNFDFTQLSSDFDFWDSYTYDSLNRVTKISNKNGDIIYNYNNLDFSITNQKNTSTEYRYDIFWNLIEVIEPGNIVTKYFYNPNNLLVKIQDAHQNIREMSYDFLGQRLSIDDLHTQWDNNFWKREYVYDLQGNISKMITLWWEEIDYEYDELDRIILETYSGSTTQYNYDIWENALWKLSSYQKWDYSETYTYNSQWFVIWESKKYGTDSYNYSYDFNLQWMPITTIFPDNSVSENIYKNGFYDSMKYNNQFIVKSSLYNPSGWLEKLVYGNDSVILNTFEYPYEYRLDASSLNIWWTQAIDIDYTFDALWNISHLSYTGSISNIHRNVSYLYDDLNRLTQADYKNNEIYSYWYDELWNILENSSAWKYFYEDLWTNNPHSVSKIESYSWTTLSTVSFKYDNNGNVISDISGKYFYNPKDELIWYENIWGQKVEYFYDANSVRVSKTGSGYIHNFLNKDYEIHQNFTQSWSELIIKKYLFFNNQKIATIENLEWDIQNEKIVYHFQDHLSSWVVDFWIDWTILQSVDYLPYWELRSIITADNHENNYLFTGKQRDKESWLDYFEARFYNSDVARFRSIDRVFWEVWTTVRGFESMYMPQNLNWYSYAGNNPIVYSDPNWEFRKKKEQLKKGVWLLDGFLKWKARQKMKRYEATQKQGEFIDNAINNIKVYYAKKNIKWSTVDKPDLDKIENTKLRNIISDNYKERNWKTIWNWSTADAIRNEIITNKPTNWKFHTDKWLQSINWIRNLLKKWNLSDSDRNTALKVFNDLKDALNTKK